MALEVSSLADEGERLVPAIPQHQVAAAAAPHRRTSELLGSFRDFETLFDQLGQPVLIELGKPLPTDKHLPRSSAISCPAEHNRLLLD